MEGMSDAPSTDGFLPDWLSRLITNLGVYFMMVLIAYFIIKYIKRSPPSELDNSPYARSVRYCVFGPTNADLESSSTNTSVNDSNKPKKELSFGLNALLLSFCTFGLLGSYLSWGLLQERIMSTEYNTGKFKSSNFLVFCNRILALCVAITVTRFTKQPKFKAPFYKFSFTSLSNVLSSWCQLEALKYVSFPTQVLGKYI